MIIYLIQNLVNDKGYVGKTVGTFARRWSLHCSQARRGSAGLLHRAIRKYGVEHFEHCILGTAHTIAELNELEKYHIAAQGTLVPNGYNLTMGGEGSVGWSPSEETRTKISVSHMGMARKQSQEERAKRSANMTGKPRHHSDEWRKKRSLLMTGRKLSDSHRAAISEGNKGKKLSEAHRAKLRKPKSEDSKAKMKIAALRRYHPLLFNDLSLYTGSSR